MTASITVHDTTLTMAQIPSHSHGGSTGIEDVGQIYYDINSAPTTSGMCERTDNQNQSFNYFFEVHSATHHPDGSTPNLITTAAVVSTVIPLRLKVEISRTRTRLL